MKLSVPVPLKIAALVVGATALYTYIGQLVPQKEVQPPQETVMSDDMTTDDLVRVGQEVAQGKGLCFTCHTIGKSGALRFPDLDGIGTRAATRIEGQNAVQYLAHSIYDPNGYIVEGFTAGMPAINKPPIGLNDQEILAVIAYLQSLGGTPSVTLATTKAELGME
jgi:mono/diheme cytochrome c family protein